MHSSVNHIWQYIVTRERVKGRKAKSTLHASMAACRALDLRKQSLSTVSKALAIAYADESNYHV